MMKKMLGCAILSGLLFFSADILSAKEFSLFRNGEKKAVILAAPDKEVAGAIQQFNEDIFRCTGQKLPVVKKAGKGVGVIRFQVEKRPVMKEDDYSITFPDANTLLITCSSFSARNALLYILEEHAGVRYLFPTPITGCYGEEINHYPAIKNLSIPRKKVTKSASYTLNRNVDWRKRLWTVKWYGRPRLINGHMIPIDVFPVYKYAIDQSWPENVMPIHKGKRFLPPKAKGPLHKNPYRAKAGYDVRWNPCFSHPDTTRIAIENILEILDKDPERVSINLGINDNGGMCECAVCRKSVGKNNSVGRQDYSKLYWKWVHDVASAVTKKYPNVYFSCLAYREVINPPSFKIHKNVVPQICFDLNAMDDEEVYARRLKLLQDWKKVCETIDFWDYSYGIKYFLFPKVYFKNHSQRLKLLYDHHVRSMFVECHIASPVEGPKYYLMAKMLYDLNNDPEKILMDWCNAAVGEKAAPHLRKYYDFWEKYYQRPELKNTTWYASRFSTYMALGDPASYTLALHQGDMKYLRSLMEKVVSLTETPAQKRRAAVLMKAFEVSEDAATILFSELLQSDGSLRNASDALSMLRSLPAALQAQKRLLKNPYVKEHFSRGDLQAPMLAQMGALLPFLKDPQVLAEARKLANDTKLPKQLRGMLKIWMGAKLPNLIPNGSFEKARPWPKTHWNEGGARKSNDIASHGKSSFRVPNCTYSFSVPAAPGKTYLFLFDAYIKNPSVEGRINYQISPRLGNRYLEHRRYLNNTIPAGKWTTFTGLCAGNPRGDNILLMFYLRKLEKEDKVYLDNFRAYCLDDLEIDPPGEK